MKGTLIFGCAMFFTLFISCKEKSGEKVRVTESLDSVSETSTHKKSVISFDIPNAGASGEIVSKEWELPQRFQETWKDAREIKYSDTLRFKEVKNSFVINFTVLSKDSQNFILKNIKIIGPTDDSTQYNFTGEISEQFNMGTRVAYSMGAIITITAILKPEIAEVEGVNKIYGVGYSVIAKDGSVKEL
jgi:hypothetical protein